jgi:hypothetical protein
MRRRVERGAALRHAAPTLLAAVLAALYVIVSPPSLDLAAHLFRAKLFSAEGFGIWDNWWYGGHHVVLYSVLFPPIAAALSPQVAAALAAIASAAVFERLARRHFGEDAWLGSLWFGAGTATSLFTGRLTFAFGILPALGCAVALERRRYAVASGMAVVTALASPVAALFAALAGLTSAVGDCWRERTIRSPMRGLAVAVAALAPVVVLAIAFPEGGSEPFTLATLWPLPVIGVATALALGRREETLVAGITLYTVGLIASYEIPTAVGSNAARLGELVAGPLAALILWPRRKVLLLAAVIPLAYIQWHAPVRDVSSASADPSISASFYRPLLIYLAGQKGPPFRVEIPFTRFHWETYQVAPRFPLARGWERQLDIKYNHLFYGGPLTPATYNAWLHQLAIRFVAVSDARLDYSAHRETALIDRGLPYLRLVLRTHNWRVYAVRNPTPIVQGAAALKALGPNSLTLQAQRAGTVFVRVRFTPYWALSEGSGCVAPDGEFTKLTLRHAGPVRLVIRFSLARIRARSPRCA